MYAPLAHGGAPLGFGDLGRMAIFFRELESAGNYFGGVREQAHNFGDKRSLAKKENK